MRHIYHAFSFLAGGVEVLSIQFIQAILVQVLLMEESERVTKSLFDRAKTLLAKNNITADFIDVEVDKQEKTLVCGEMKMWFNERLMLMWFDERLMLRWFDERLMLL